jgi:hypothetical protein
MGLLQEQMEKIEVESYKDCVWYMPEIDKCKLPGTCGERYSKCGCKEGKLNEVCVWITKFLKSTPKSIELDREKPEDVTDKYGFYVVDTNDDASFLNTLSKIFKGGN